MKPSARDRRTASPRDARVLASVEEHGDVSGPGPLLESEDQPISAHRRHVEIHEHDVGLLLDDAENGADRAVAGDHVEPCGPEHALRHLQDELAVVDDHDLAPGRRPRGAITVCAALLLTVLIAKWAIHDLFGDPETPSSCEQMSPPILRVRGGAG
jgi:hypothetical protein